MLHYEVRGTVPAVLLVHGTTGDVASYWGQLRDELAATSRVVTYAQRGFGRSSGSHARRLDVGLLAKDAAALVEHVGAAPVSVVGMSLGGLVAQELAARRPELMDRLVLVATAPAVGTRLGLLGSVLGRAAISGDPGLLFCPAVRLEPPAHPR